MAKNGGVAGNKKPSKTSKSVRDAAVVAKSAQGKSNTTIAKEMKLNRQTVAKILNSPEAISRVEKMDNVLETGINDALLTVLQFVKMDYLAARDLLRNFGTMTDKKQVEVSGKLTLEDLIGGADDASTEED